MTELLDLHGADRNHTPPKGLSGEHDDFPLVLGILDVQNVQPVQPRQTLQEFHSSVCSEHGSLMIAMDLQE